ncbi:heterokaryon incompatibility protein HET-6-like protein [Colletotrichum kahawae]|uniref:Heterokaryon incompatibility protein HET-6-like protein n=1 Tax=Colletotrichum kahawae TaxID=34407 RepID=A0AAD9XY58_COLKA|nr:heterokaryon incompatibility protein HET-6-like protein [Colletotrichum kahawae]
MSRWHSQTCLLPDVYLQDTNVPGCRGCGMTAETFVTLRRSPEDEDTIPVPAVPPDEPRGKFNLWWPSSNLYNSASLESEKPTLIKDPGNVTRKPGAGECDTSMDNVAGSYNACYDRPLVIDEFRLACLPSIPVGVADSYPIHLAFEVFEDHRYPDYDTVSYTWGGENGDYSLSEIIYIGEYWDVMRTTRNCWTMLRYLRPWRGIKLVWVDIICINQCDMRERANQVSKMGLIYSNCNQVVLWLGDDVVQHNQAAIPIRHQIDELYAELANSQSVQRLSNSNTSDDTKASGLEALFARKYFSRVWVIQELIMSPRVLIPHGTTTYWAGPFSDHDVGISHNPGAWGWANTLAPWFKLIAQGLSHKKRLFEILALTSKSEASDCRDKLYGILGLLSGNAKSSTLFPDYSISYQHVMFGMLAFVLLEKREFRLLLAARGVSSDKSVTTDLPSWTPSWDKPGDWWRTLKKMEQTRWPTDYWFYQAASWRRSQNLPWPPPSGNKALGFFRLLRSHEISTHNLWYHDASIHADTGSASLWAFKLVTIQSKFQHTSLPILGSVYQSKLNGSGSICIESSKIDLRNAIKEGDELYVLNSGLRDTSQGFTDLVFMFLRKEADMDDTFNLTTCVSDVLFCSGEWYTVNSTSVDDIAQRLSASIATLRAIWNLSVYLFDGHMASQGMLGSQLSQVFPGHESTPFADIVPIIVRRNGFGRLWNTPVAQKLRARLTGDFFELAFSVDDWNLRKGLYSTPKDYVHRDKCPGLVWEMQVGDG